MAANYCTLADVNNLVPQVPFTATSKPNSTIVNGMIASISLLIDANISTVYQTPVSVGPLSLQILSDLCAWGVAGRAQEARVTAVQGELAGVKSVWTKKFEEWLEMLVDPADPFTLPDAPKNADFIEKVASQITDSNVLSFPDADSDDADNLGDTRPTVGDVF